MLQPGDIIKAPVCYTTVGTAPTVITETTGSTTGGVVTHAALTTSSQDDLWTVYCRTGANRGQYRVVTTGATTSQTVTIQFHYDIAIGDTFVTAAVTIGKCRVSLDSQIQAWLGNFDNTATYFSGYCHQLNLEEAGREWAAIALAAHHFWDAR
jgi:hypothetical protein